MFSFFRHLLAAISLVALLSCLPGCRGVAHDDNSSDDDDDDDSGDDDDSADDSVDTAGLLTIGGSWDDGWGGSYTITDADWSDSWGSSFTISQFDNNSRLVIAENDASNAFNPGLWSRFDWTWSDDNTLWYCQTCYDCADEAAALATAAADPTDPATGGCGGFAWTSLTPQPSSDTWMLTIGGSWSDLTDGNYSIDDSDWTDAWGSSFTISQFDNNNQWVIAENDASNAFNPGLWSRFDWSWSDDNTLWYCQTCYDCADEAAALATPAADPTDPGTGGCGGFAWSSLSPSP